MSFENFDRQLLGVLPWLELDGLDVGTDGRHLASGMHAEACSLPEDMRAEIVRGLHVPPERALEDLAAFNAWIELAEQQVTNPVVVRARVITELYASLLWHRDGLLDLVARRLDAGTTSRVIDFMRSGQRRRLRNGFAHGNWSYLEDFSGLEFWARPDPGQPNQRYEIRNEIYGAYQVLGRATTTVLLLALVDRKP